MENLSNLWLFSVRSNVKLVIDYWENGRREKGFMLFCIQGSHGKHCLVFSFWAMILGESYKRLSFFGYCFCTLSLKFEVAEKMEEKGSFVWFFILASLRKHCLPFIFELRMVRAISFYVFVVLRIFLVILSCWESGRKEKLFFFFCTHIYLENIACFFHFELKCLRTISIQL